MLVVFAVWWQVLVSEPCRSDGFPVSVRWAMVFLKSWFSFILTAGGVGLSSREAGRIGYLSHGLSQWQCHA
ncbi:hypothetical protein [Succinimonas amylolytica]|uniref:hypothetical protein n=1 Tax=Succinimonas amylolytica TaxID=83769 RepID=UPI0023A7A398